MPTTILPYLPLLSMAGWIAMFASKHRSLFLGDCMGLVYHLALVPVVGLLPGGEALRFIGYLWLLTDSMVDMASINGVDHHTAWRARMCVHLPAAIWITGASAGMTGPALVISRSVALSASLIRSTEAPLRSMSCRWTAPIPNMQLLQLWRTRLLSLRRRASAASGQ